MGIRRVTSIRTIIDLMNSNSLTKTMLSQVDQLYLTIPLTSERSFSTLRRLKKLHEISKSIKPCYTHKDMTDNLDISLVTS